MARDHHGPRGNKHDRGDMMMRPNRPHGNGWHGNKHGTYKYRGDKHYGKHFDKRYYKHHGHRHPGNYYVYGHRVRVIPRHCVLLRYRNRPYYYADGVFYRPYGREYEIIRPEIGMVVPALPAGRVTVVSPNTDDLYLCGGVTFQKILRNGEVQFCVVRY
jgi:hypothetical protein